MSQQSPWRLFASWSTLVTGLISAAVFALSWDWRAGVFFVVLLYIHEVGHLLAALWRKMPVTRGPVFLPGLGAFVVVGSEGSAWDRAFMSLAGPIIGAVAALIAKRVGISSHLPTLALAGDFALLVNLINLAPFTPLDGGQSLSRSGWLGLIPTGLAAWFVLTKVRDSFLTILALYGSWQAFKTFRHSKSAGFFSSLGILLLYGITLITIFLMTVLSGRTATVPSHLPHWMPSTWAVINFAVWAYIISTFAFPYTQRPGTSAAIRYLGLALFGWPRLVAANPALIPAFLCLGAEGLHLPGLLWLERYIGYLLRVNPAGAGAACAHGYDYLVLSGQQDAAAGWMYRTGPRLEASGGLAAPSMIAQLVGLRHVTYAGFWADRWIDSHPEPLPGAPPMLLNNIAWTMAVNGTPGRGLPFARAAVAAAPDNASYLDTLGRLLAETGAASEAEACLRQSLERVAHPSSRLYLARALAEQGKYGEACEQAGKALQHQGPWPQDIPGRDEVESWIASWQAVPASPPPAEPF